MCSQNKEKETHKNTKNDKFVYDDRNCMMKNFKNANMLRLVVKKLANKYQILANWQL